MVRTIKEIKEEISKNWKDVHFSIEQRDFVIKLLRKVRPQYCLETGFCAGASSSTILAAALPKKLISVSLEHTNQEISDKLEEQYSFTLIEGNSLNILIPEFFESNYPEGIDFFHVDGGHKKNIVCSDLESAFPFMNKGSVILVDDYFSKQCPMPFVDEAVDEFVKKYSLLLKKISMKDRKGMAMITIEKEYQPTPDTK